MEGELQSGCNVREKNKKSNLKNNPYLIVL